MSRIFIFVKSYDVSAVYNSKGESLLVDAITINEDEAESEICPVCRTNMDWDAEYEIVMNHHVLTDEQVDAISQVGLGKYLQRQEKDAILKCPQCGYIKDMDHQEAIEIAKLYYG